MRRRPPRSTLFPYTTLFRSRPTTRPGEFASLRQRSSGCGCWRDRKSTRLNSSHSQISYAVFCLKKKNFVVDDAIVMIENCFRNLEKGMTPFRAAIEGAHQIGFTVLSISISLVAFFFNVPATTEIYTLSLHDALPIWHRDEPPDERRTRIARRHVAGDDARPVPDRKSTRLNSSHSQISYAVLCLKKKTLKRRTGHFADNKKQFHRE